MGHIHKLYDFTTSAFIVNDGRVLLQHHVKIGKWLQPGGHIELNEDPLQALYREIEEETGLTATDLTIIELAKDKRSHGSGSKLLPIPFDINVHDFDDTHKHIDFCYAMLSNTGKVRLEKGKAHDIGWFTLLEVKKMVAEGGTFQDMYDLAKIALKHAG